MPQTHPVDQPNILRELQARQREFEERLRRLEGRRTVAIDRAVTADVPAPMEGQLAVEASSDKAKYYSNGQWRDFAGAAGEANISAVGHDYGRSRQLTGGGTLAMQFQNIYWNDDSFGYENVVAGTPTRAEFITISEPGWWWYLAHVTFTTDFAVGDAPFIEPSCYFPSTDSTDVLDNSFGLDGFPGNAILTILEEQFTAAEMDHHQLISTRLFNFDPDEWGEDSIGLGVNIGATNTVTKTFSGSVAVTRLGDLLELQTIT